MDYTLEGEEFFKKTAYQIKTLFVPFEENNFRPKFLESKFLLYCVLCLFILRIFTSVISVNFSKNIFFADVTKNALVNYVNQSRQAEGLQPLIRSEKLDQAAMLKAQDMIDNDYFSHQSPQGVTPWYWFLKTGYNYKFAGENLAIGFLNSNEVFDAWFNSPSHKENMLNPNYKEIGTAILDKNFGEGKTTLVVQFFGSPLVLSKKTQPIVQQPVVQQIVNDSTDSQLIPENLPEDQENKEVLSQTSEYPVLKAVSGDNSNTLYLKFLNFIFYRYDEILKAITYAMMTLVAIALLLNIVIYFNIQHTDLILRSIIIIVLLASATLIDRNIIALFLPQRIII